MSKSSVNCVPLKNFEELGRHGSKKVHIST